MAVLAGKSGAISLGGTAYAFGKWTADMSADILDVTVFTSSGYKANIAGLVGAKITADGPFNSTAMALTAGNSYAFVLTMDSGVTLTVTARVGNINVVTDVKDAVRVSISAESTGSFTAALV
jgi:hypothetical protein